MAKGDQEAETVIVIIEKKMSKVDTSRVLLFIPVRWLEMTMSPPAGGGFSLIMFTIHGNLLAWTTGYSLLLEGEVCRARGDPTAAATTLAKEAGQGADQATDQGPLLEG